MLGGRYPVKSPAAAQVFDLVARAGQITAAIIAAKVVALRRAGAGIDDIDS